MLLKPALARGELHCVTTTLDEYRKHIEKDAALARRFQPVFVAEPGVPEPFDPARLEGRLKLRPRQPVQFRHRRGGSASPIATSPTVSCRTRPSIDRRGGQPAGHGDQFQAEWIDEIDRRLIQLKIKREALKKETDKASAERLKDLEGEIRQLEKQSADMTAGGDWQAEKQMLVGEQKLKEQLEKAKTELEQAQRKAISSARRRTALRCHSQDSTEDRNGRGRRAASPVLNDGRRRERGGRRRLALDRHSGGPDAGG